MSINSKDVKFEAPVRNDLAIENRHYYTQSLKYQDQDLLLKTEYFHSNGFQKSFEKNSLLVPLSTDMYNILKTIEDVAVDKGLQLPAEFQIPNIANEAIFRRTF